MKDVLQHYNIPLDGMGKAPCPVHGGKDKNFTVKGDVVSCWSQCGKTWDTIGIIEQLENKTPYEAMIILAEIGGVAVEYDNTIDRAEWDKQQLLQKNEKSSFKIANEEFLAKYLKPIDCNSIIPNENDPSGVVAGRSLKESTINEFQLRELPTHSFYSVFESLHLNKEVVIGAGLIKENERGMYDVWRERWIFPTYDDNDTLVGFVGRIRADAKNQDTAKYMNTAENALYHKGEILYGLYHTKKHIKEAKHAILVEGQMDVISMYDQGIKNVVAGGGTAFTYDQAKKLAKYTGSVTLFYDGDEAGQKAAIKNIPLLLRAGLEVKICHLSTDMDPDKYIREWGTDTTKEYLLTNSVDAVIWAIHHDYDPEDVFQHDIKLKQAIYILSNIKKPSILNKYIERLSPKAMMGASFTKSLKEGLKKAANGGGRNEIKLTTAQQEDIFNFGIYEDNSKYYLCHDITQGRGWEITNFVIRPIMLVVGSERSDRLVEIKNEHGQKFVRAISSDDFVEVGTFKKQMERNGNFLYKGKPESFIHIKEKVYLTTPTAYPINTLGYHKLGFYAWSNGVTLSTGEFLKVDEYGIVEVEGAKFFLPAFSKVYQYIMSDDQDNEQDKDFIYQEGECPTMSEWASMMIEVYGDHGKLGMGWYFASMYRDIIYKKLKFFPHLNFFGPPGSGKSFLGWSISSMYGNAKKPFHLMQGTPVGLYRRMAQLRNALAWMDEYSNDLPVKVVEALKSAYDGVGHEKGVKSSDDRTMVTKPNSGIIITGQHQPTKDIALFERCITLMFKNGQFTAEQEAKALKLKVVQESRVLSQITGKLHSYRAILELKWDKYNLEVQKDLRRESGNENVKSRIMINYSVPLTAFKIINEIEQLPWSYEDMLRAAVEYMTVQHKAIGNDDECTVWWRIVAFCVADRQLEHDKDILVKDGVTTITIKSVNVPGMPRTTGDSHTVTFDVPKKLLYLRFERSHPLYLEMHKSQHSKQGFGMGALQHYLRFSPAYIGEVKSQRFNMKSKGAWVFDTALLPIELDLSSDFTQRYDGPTPELEIINNDKPSDTPF